MASESKESDRRQHTRYPAHLVVTLQAVDANHEPLGEPIDAVGMDLSQSGICCMSDRPLIGKFAIVRMLAAGSDKEVSLLARRIRCRRNSVMFESALQFIGKLPANSEQATSLQEADP